jgi:hypothetical protein
MPITIVDNPYVTLWYHPDKKIVHHQIHKFVTGNDFRTFLLAGTEVLRKNLARKWLSDDRANMVLGKADLDWSQAQWAPQTAQAGWRYWAIVKPEKVLATVAMEQLVTKYATLGVSASFFANPRDAMTWLERQ